MSRALDNQLYVNTLTYNGILCQGLDMSQVDLDRSVGYVLKRAQAALHSALEMRLRAWTERSAIRVSRVACPAAGSLTVRARARRVRDPAGDAPARHRPREGGPDIESLRRASPPLQLTAEGSGS